MIQMKLFTKKTETDSQTQKTNLPLPKGKGRGREGQIGSLGLTQTHFYIYEQQQIYKIDNKQGPTV